jgi:predicted RND superfamily exporter protein
MDSVRFRIAKWVMDNRVAMAIAFVVVTVFFAVGMRGVEFRTIFSDLLPKDDPFVEVYKDHPGFGNPLTMTIMVKRLDGDIYHHDTLSKVWELTRDIDLAPGVDHDQILSIATEKARYAEATPYGIDMRPLMDDRVPETDEEMEDFRRRVEQSPNARTFLVSQDETATIINATFIERLLDYDVAFEYAQALVEAARDENHEVHLAGQPALTGWVYRYQMDMRWIFAVTIIALLIALSLYMRNVVGVVTPVVCSVVAAIWGLGLVGWMKSPIEPLLMVVPLLLVARSFSHCVQFIERYYEVYAHVRDRRKAAEITMSVMMAPSILGIITDTAGILLIAVAPIPAMERFALFAGFWSIAIIPTGVFLISIMLSWLPEPKNVERLAGTSQQSGGVHKRFRDVLGGISTVTNGRRGRVTAVLVAILAIGSIYTAMQIKIGNPVEGSGLLWPDDEFNVAVSQINSHFPGVNTLEIVLEAKERDPSDRVARRPETVATALRIQSIVEADQALPPRATLSFADYMMEGNRLFSGGNPKWLPLDMTEEATNGNPPTG